MWLATAIMAFITTCTGLGYLSGRLVRRRKWPGWMSGLMSVAIAFLWPAILVGSFMYGAGYYQPQSPSDVGDAPAYVFIGILLVAPLLFLFGLGLALMGAHLARRRHPEVEHTDRSAA